MIELLHTFIKYTVVYKQEEKNDQIIQITTVTVFYLFEEVEGNMKKD